MGFFLLVMLGFFLFWVSVTASITKFILQSDDNGEFEVDRDVIRLSTTLNTKLQYLEMDELDAGESLNDLVPLSNVNGPVLRRIIQWCQVSSVL